MNGEIHSEYYFENNIKMFGITVKLWGIIIFSEVSLEASSTL